LVGYSIGHIPLKVGVNITFFPWSYTPLKDWGSKEVLEEEVSFPFWISKS